MSFTPISYKILNENKITLCKYGKMIMEKHGNKTTGAHCNMSNEIQLSFDTTFAEHNERFVAKFDREENRIRIYNVTDSYIYE